MIKLFSGLSTRWKIFIVIFLMSSAISFISAFTSYVLRVEQARQDALSSMKRLLYHSEKELHMSMKDYQNLVKLISGQISLLCGEKVLVKDKNRKIINERMNYFAGIMDNLMQLRLLDIDGKEIFRTERKKYGGELKVISEEDLQDKSSRYYYKELVNSASGMVWISELDLNIERGAVEVPEIPTIRVAKLIIKDGKKRGIVIANFFGDFILENFKSRDNIEVFLADHQGRYITHPDNQKEFSKDRNVMSDIFSDYSYMNVVKNDGFIERKDGFIGKKIELSGKRYFYVMYRLKDEYLTSIHIQQILLSIVLYVLSAGFALIMSYVVAGYSAPMYDNKVNEVDHLKFVTKDLNEKVGELEKDSHLDPLTGLYNRRYFEKRIEIFEQNKLGYGLILADIDNFKMINDDFGHDIGDKILVKIAELMKEHIRETDFLVRWGGEEFYVVILSAKKNMLLRISEKLRSIIENHDFEIGRSVTSSFGVTIKNVGEGVNDALKRTDEALYKAKRDGRNRVIYSV